MLRLRILAFLVAALTSFCGTALPSCDSVKIRITDALDVCADNASTDNGTCGTEQCKDAMRNITGQTLTTVLTECGEETSMSINPDAKLPDSAKTCNGSFGILEYMHQCEKECTANCTKMLEDINAGSIADLVAGFKSCSPESEFGQIVAEVDDIEFVWKWIVHHVAEVCEREITHAPTPAPQWHEDDCYDHTVDLKLYSGMMGMSLESCDVAASLCKNESRLGEEVRKACLHTCDTCHLKPRANAHGDECLGFTGNPLVCMHGDADGCWVHVGRRVWEESNMSCSKYCSQTGRTCTEAFEAENDHCGSAHAKDLMCDEVKHGDGMFHLDHIVCACLQTAHRNPFNDHHGAWVVKFSRRMQVDLLMIELEHKYSDCEGPFGFERSLSTCTDAQAIMTYLDIVCPSVEHANSHKQEIYNPTSCGTSSCRTFFQLIEDETIEQLRDALLSCEGDWRAEKRKLGEQGVDMMKRNIFQKRATECGVETVFAEPELDTCAGSMNMLDSIRASCPVFTDEHAALFGKAAPIWHNKSCDETGATCAALFEVLTEENVSKIAEGLATCSGDDHHDEWEIWGHGGVDLMKLDLLDKYASRCNITTAYTHNFTPGTCAFSVNWKLRVESACPEREDCFHATDYISEGKVDVDQSYCLDRKPERSNDSCGIQRCEAAFQALSDHEVQHIFTGFRSCKGEHSKDWLFGPSKLSVDAFKRFILEHIRVQCGVRAGYTQPHEIADSCIGAIDSMWSLNQNCPYRSYCEIQGRDPRTCKMATLVRDPESCRIEDCRNTFADLTDEHAENMSMGISKCSGELLDFVQEASWTKTGTYGVKEEWIRIGLECQLRPNISDPPLNTCEGASMVTANINSKCKTNHDANASCNVKACEDHFAKFTFDDIVTMQESWRNCKGEMADMVLYGQAPAEMVVNFYRNIANQCGVDSSRLLRPTTVGPSTTGPSTAGPATTGPTSSSSSSSSSTSGPTTTGPTTGSNSTSQNSTSVEEVTSFSCRSSVSLVLSAVAGGTIAHMRQSFVL